MTRAYLKRRDLAAWAIAFATMGIGFGCGCDGPSANPTAADARASLESALAAWRDGKKPTDLASAEPPILMVDGEWTKGGRLADFEVLREEPSESDKRFVVKLVHVPPAAEDEEVVYIVLGAGPISVFRAEDYERTMNMDNNPTPTPRKRR